MNEQILATCTECGRALRRGDEVYENEVKVVNVDLMTVKLVYRYSCWPKCPETV